MEPRPPDARTMAVDRKLRLIMDSLGRAAGALTTPDITQLKLFYVKGQLHRAAMYAIEASFLTRCSLEEMPPSLMIDLEPGNNARHHLEQLLTQLETEDPKWPKDV